MAAASGIDPNLFASLARAYTGGMRAPSPGQEGNFARVDASGTNLQYDAGPAELFTEAHAIKSSSGAVVGTKLRVVGRAVTSTTSSVDLCAFSLPFGSAAFIVSDIYGHNGTRSLVHSGMYRVFDAEITEVLNNTVGTLTGVAPDIGAGNPGADVPVTFGVGANSADGVTTWTCILDVTILT